MRTPRLPPQPANLDTCLPEKRRSSLCAGPVVLSYRHVVSRSSVSVPHTIEAIQLLARARTGPEVASVLRERLRQDVLLTPVIGPAGSTDFLRLTFASEATGPTVGLVGRLGGLRTSPDGALVSDADGAIAVIAAALALADGWAGRLPAGAIIISTHITSEAPVIESDPVPMVGSPIPMDQVNRVEVSSDMDLVLSVDATKANRVVNGRGIGFTPPVLRGWVLPVPKDVIDIYERVTGGPAQIVPLSTYDITPYGNGLPHLNSIVQPATGTDSPVLGIATISERPVPGIATGANQVADIALAVQFAIEVAVSFIRGECQIYDAATFEGAIQKYGSLAHLSQI